MTFKFSKTIAACIALSTMTFASSAHANNAFNKFPAEQGVKNTQNIHTTAHVRTYVTVEKSTQSNTRIKRVVKSVPKTSTDNVAFASEHGSSNLTDGFNKMSPKTDAGVQMPTFVDNKAKMAR